MNIENTPIALELIKISKELVINEYTDKRAQEHNKWLINSEKLWKFNKVNLPYPDIPPYPTENDIIKKAQILMDFLIKNNNENIDYEKINNILNEYPLNFIFNDEEN
jgi:hypothetical protein